MTLRGICPVNPAYGERLLESSRAPQHQSLCYICPNPYILCITVLLLLRKCKFLPGLYCSPHHGNPIKSYRVTAKLHFMFLLLDFWAFVRSCFPPLFEHAVYACITVCQEKFMHVMSFHHFLNSFFVMQACCRGAGGNFLCFVTSWVNFSMDNLFYSFTF